MFCIDVINTLQCASCAESYSNRVSVDRNKTACSNYYYYVDVGNTRCISKPY